jgi:hypothetical protein
MGNLQNMTVGKFLQIHESNGVTCCQRLVVDSAIFQSENAEVGTLIGDDDISTTVACLAASTHPISNNPMSIMPQEELKTIVQH